MRLDVHHFYHADATEAESSRRTIHLLGIINGRLENIMALIDDLQTKADATLAQVQSNSDLDDSIINMLVADAARIGDLKAALDAAGTDPVKLQTLSDTMEKISAASSAEAKKKADAITANTTSA